MDLQALDFDNSLSLHVTRGVYAMRDLVRLMTLTLNAQLITRQANSTHRSYATYIDTFWGNYIVQ